jgi:hypothetical protein
MTYGKITGLELGNPSSKVHSDAIHRRKNDILGIFESSEWEKTIPLPF